MKTQAQIIAKLQELENKFLTDKNREQVAYQILSLKWVLEDEQ